jgi:hypothetical protein
MARNSSKIASTVASLLLSAITLGTFYALRNYGPESAIQRFHAAALSGDKSEIARVTLQNPQDPTVLRLEQLVIDAAQQHASAQVQDVQRGPHRVIVWIAYLLPGQEQDIYWVVDQTRASRWAVNSRETLFRRPWGF